MKKILLFILLGCRVSGLYAETSYEQRIARYKSTTNAVMLPHARKGAMREYCAWARSLTEVNAFTEAADLYRQALEDPFLLEDHRAFVATELAALYNDHMLMPTSALEVLTRYPYPAGNKDAWIASLRLAQTKLYMRQYDEALRVLDSIMGTQSQPDYDLYATRGYLLMSMGNDEAAMRDLEQAQQMTTDSTDYYRIASNIAPAQARKGECAAAGQTMDACIRYAIRSRNEADASIYFRKRANLELVCGDTIAAAADYKKYWEREKDYIIRHFAAMTEQQRLDYWANRKPLISGAFRLGAHDADFLADVAVFRHQAALLGVHEKTRSLLQARLKINAKQVQQRLAADEAAIEFVKYQAQNQWRYAAIVLTRNEVRFVPLWDEESLRSFPIGHHTLMDAICANSDLDKNRIYCSEELAQRVWEPLMPYIQDKKEVWFAPDGILHLLAIEYLPTGHERMPNLHRLTSTGLLAQRQKSGKPKSVNALLIGGLDYDYLEAEDQPAGKTNQNGLRYWVNTRNKLAYFTYLPGSREEVDSIAHHIARWEKTYDEPEELLKSEFANFNVVHLSTHGYSLDVAVSPQEEHLCDSVTTDQSLLSTGFALSGANISYRYPTRDDGLLTAREICELDLRNVDFVVASACQSAQGKVQDEGPAGLLRGLKLAGVGTVIATLWPVDDAATTLFMQYFYQAWRNGKGADGKGCTKQQALRIAQEQLRAYGKEQYRTKRTFNASKLHGQYTQTKGALYDAPYYWAPFIIVDDLEN